MQTIQIQKIIDLQGLDTRFLAMKLFPSHKFPAQALDRVIKGEGLLNSEQVLTLSEITNLPIGFLYASGEWTASGNLNKITYVAGEVTAEIDMRTFKTKISHTHKGHFFVETLVHPADIKASVYLSELTDTIIKNSKYNKL